MAGRFFLDAQIVLELPPHLEVEGRNRRIMFHRFAHEVQVSMLQSELYICMTLNGCVESSCFMNLCFFNAMAGKTE
jgi:hypothetical protein